MNIVLRELRANLKSLTIWSVGMMFMIYAGMVKYSAFAGAGQDVNVLMGQIPDAIRKILGMNGLDLTTVSGFYAMFYVYFMLLVGIHAIMLGAVIISKEERDKTADFLFVKPIPRSKVITSKLIAALINIIILNLITWIASILFVGIYNKGEPVNDQIARLMLALFIVQLIFLAVGAGIGAFARNTKKSTSIATAVLLLAFTLSIAMDLSDKVDLLRFLTPFKYFGTTQIIKEGIFDPIYLVLSLVIVVGFTVATYVAYRKRDIHV